jgi:L,D-transpeptidase ErfK/SrfK
VNARVRGAGWVVAVVLLAGCAARGPLQPGADLPPFTEAAFASKPGRVFTIPTPKKGEPAAVSVIGATTTYTVRDGDTLLDVARWYDLGLNELTAANPGVDEWVPPVGKTIVVPTAWVLPCCTYEGMVVNIPEMRLYFYERAPGDPSTTIVRTYPVGLGRDDRRTPRKPFRVVGKTVNPTWNIPARIRADRIREKNDRRSSIAGGHPDNPLGRYRFDLDISPYAIHGTNIPWGIGMQVSNGCARLYPEDVERLFPLVRVGTPGAFVYQPVKVGRRDGRVWVEAHSDMYAYRPALPAGSAALLRRGGLRADAPAFKSRVKDASGIPEPVADDAAGRRA